MDWQALERINHADPALRGLASYRVSDAWLDGGQLQAAATDLAGRGQTVAIVTGFCRATATGFAAETDGPPGALYLARALDALGLRVLLVGDRYASPLLEAGRRLWQLERVEICELPLEDRGPPDASDGALPQTDAWCQHFFAGPARGLTHLIASERPAPSHSLESLRAQPDFRPELAERFTHEVSAAARNRCHNMRGVDIDAVTAKAERLFELAPTLAPQAVTIGIGDGGNEIGMGAIGWETLCAAIASPVAARVASRIATKYLLLAGVSDWGAFALALAVCQLRGAIRLAASWDERSQSELVAALVQEAGARRRCHRAGDADGRRARSGGVCRALDRAAARLRRLSGRWRPFRTRGRSAKIQARRRAATPA